MAKYKIEKTGDNEFSTYCAVYSMDNIFLSYDWSERVANINPNDCGHMLLKDGIPIGLGYLSVSFTFGIMAVSLGLNSWQALLISMLTLTSAGQLAAISIMVNPGRYFEMFVTQFTINVRYAFMGIVLSQKRDSKFNGIWKWLLAFFITDEIFAIASIKKEVSRIYLLDNILDILALKKDGLFFICPSLSL